MTSEVTSTTNLSLTVNNSFLDCKQVDTPHSFNLDEISLPRGRRPLPGSRTGSSQSHPATQFIRAARREDLSDIASLLTQSFYPASGLMGWFSPLLRMGVYQDLRSRVDPAVSRQICLVATQRDGASESDGYCGLVGTVEVTLRCLSPWQLAISKSPYISNLAVAAKCRRQGIAQRLLLACERTVLEWGFQDLYLHVLENNQAARQLYSKIGYQVHRIDPHWTTILLKQPQRLMLHKRLTWPNQV